MISKWKHICDNTLYLALNLFNCRWRKDYRKYMLYKISFVPYNDNDSVEDIVGVSQVVEGAKSCDLEDHLQGEHAGEDDVANLQNISQFIRLTCTNKNKNK